MSKISEEKLILNLKHKQIQLEQNAYLFSLTITQYWLDNTIIIFLTIQPLFTERDKYLFYKNCKQSTRQDSTKLIHSIWMDMTKQPTKFFPDECFMRKWRLKFRVAKYRLRWNAGNMASSIMSPQRNYSITVFTSTSRLEID